MERKVFLKTLGISFATVCVGSCISACGKKSTAVPAPPSGSVISANLTDLVGIGKTTNVNGIAFYRIADGDLATSFIATQQLCTHDGGKLDWKSGANVLQCQLHQAQFNVNGVNTRGQDGKPAGSTANLITYTNITVADGKVIVKVA